MALLIPRCAAALTIGGDVAYTSDYIFRGVSETNGHGAIQLDLHATDTSGSFAGVFASSLGRVWDNQSGYELEAYLGHRFSLSTSWSASVSAVNYSYIHTGIPASSDYQELSIAASYLDSLTVTLSASPSYVRYADRYRLGRYPAYVADVAGQLPLHAGLFATVGVGYYRFTGPYEQGYAYGNAGLAFEYKGLRIDAGYYAIEAQAEYLFPYGRVGNRFAATLSWHF